MFDGVNAVLLKKNGERANSSEARTPVRAIDNYRQSLNQMNKLIFHTFNSLKLKIVNLNVKDPSAFIDTFRRAHGIQGLCCNELCFILSIVAGSLVSKSVRFLFHSFTESFDMILNYLVKPDNFNRTMNSLMFEGLEKKVSEQYDRIRELEAQLAKAQAHIDELEGIKLDENIPGSNELDLENTEPTQEDTLDEAKAKEKTIDKSPDFALTEDELKRLDELVIEIDRGNTLDLKHTDHRVLLALENKIHSKLLGDNRTIQKALENALTQIDDVRIVPGQAFIELQNLANQLEIENKKKMHLQLSNPEALRTSDPALLTEPIVKGLLDTFDIQQRLVAVY